MNKKFNEFVTVNNLIKPGEKVLLALSGGIDSVALFHLFRENKIPFSVAHCNFTLRGIESDADQNFVQDLSDTYGIKCYVKLFETKKYASINKLSIQMAARELRYKWFDEISEKHNYSKIAIAHNKNDIVETFLINLVRGTGIRGLSGLKPIKGKTIRPLLFAKRIEIVNYINSNQYNFREDSSNADTKYLRNAIRHKIIPEFEYLNPSFVETVFHSSNTLKEAEIVFKDKIDSLREKILRNENSLTYLDISQLQLLRITPYVLYEILLPYDFSFDTAFKIIDNIDSQPGKVFYSSKYKLIKDRKEFIILERSISDVEEFTIEDINDVKDLPIPLQFTRQLIDEKFNIVRNKNIATFDANQLMFPLILRKWKHGDAFYPFGMKGKKKISDYFTDQKFSAYQKDNTWLLISDHKIIWIVNHRTDNRYKVTKSTQEIIQIEANS